jgi:RiboL-PSP-HEPN
MIDELFRRQKDLATYLQEQGELSFATDVEAYLSKTLLLSAASYFESRITEAIAAYAARVSMSDEALTSLVRVKVIERQYHTYFQWSEGSRSVMPFFGMFGPTLKELAKQELKMEHLKLAAAAFLELGELRNFLVHKNFASYMLEKTAEEVYYLYKTAGKFVEYIEHKLNP